MGIHWLLLEKQQGHGTSADRLKFRLTQLAEAGNRSTASDKLAVLFYWSLLWIDGGGLTHVELPPLTESDGVVAALIHRMDQFIHRNS